METFEIKFDNALNAEQITVAVPATTDDEPTTIEDVFNSEEVQAEFPGITLEDLTGYNGSEIMSCDNREFVKGLKAKQGDVLQIAYENEEEDDGDATGSESENPNDAPGEVAVFTNGGFNKTIVEIVNHKTLLRDVLLNDEVIRKARYSQDDMLKSEVTVNGADVSNDAFDFYKVGDGVVVRVTIRVSKSGGRR
jgi:hypothetical protein